MALLTIFSRREDPRRGLAKRYGLSEISVMAICAVLCSTDDWVEGAEWCEDEEAWLKGFLDLPQGTPSHDTFGNVFRVLDPTVFECCFRERIGGLVGAVKEIIALDGKTVRGLKDGTVSPLHLVSAYATSLELTLGQEGAAGKGNELKAIRALLETLVLKGCIVSDNAVIALPENLSTGKNFSVFDQVPSPSARRRKNDGCVSDRRDPQAVLPSIATTPATTPARSLIHSRKQASNTLASSKRNSRPNGSCDGVPCSRRR